MNLFELLEKKYGEVHHAMENSWNKNNEIQLTKSEWFILNLINDETKLLASVCKNGEITRQGTHKLIQKLEVRGLVLTKSSEHNKRSKYVQLTGEGLLYYNENQQLKQILEEQIQHTLGQDNYNIFKKMLLADWNI